MIAFERPMQRDLGQPEVWSLDEQEDQATMAKAVAIADKNCVK
jgi:hypothetical protein